MTRYLTRALQLALFGVLFVAFMGLSAAFPFFPSPAAVLATAATFLTTWEIYPHLLITVYESGLGFAVAIVLGLAAGLALGTQRTVDEIFEPIILSAYAVPKIVLLPLLLMVFGVGLPAKVANAALHAVFPVLLNTVVGVRDVNTTLLKLGRSMRATRWQTFQKIVFPSMVLPVFTGLRLGLGLAVLGALLAELFESKMGLGFLVVHFYNTAQTSKMLAVILFVFVLTMAVNAVLKRTENGLSRWRVAWRF
jgi:ABC-type nitrate/sulfonate/bicarbonate transport system permease component